LPRQGGLGSRGTGFRETTCAKLTARGRAMCSAWADAWERATAIEPGFCQMIFGSGKVNGLRPSRGDAPHSGLPEPSVCRVPRLLAGHADVLEHVLIVGLGELPQRPPFTAARDPGGDRRNPCRDGRSLLAHKRLLSPEGNSEQRLDGASCLRPG